MRSKIELHHLRASRTAESKKQPLQAQHGYIDYCHFLPHAGTRLFLIQTAYFYSCTLISLAINYWDKAMTTKNATPLPKPAPVPCPLTLPADPPCPGAVSRPPVCTASPATLTTTTTTHSVSIIRTAFSWRACWDTAPCPSAVSQRCVPAPVSRWSV